MTITLPDPGMRFMAMQAIDEDQHTHSVYYAAGSHTLTRRDYRYTLCRCGSSRISESHEQR